MADSELMALLQQNMNNQAASGLVQQTGPQPIVPLWRVRPKGNRERVNLGQIGGDLRTQDGGRVTSGRETVDLKRDYYTADSAASAFLEMDDKERNEFRDLALQAGLLNMPQDGFISQDDIFNAWQKATGYASKYNGQRDKDKWLSPWEAAQKLALETKAGKNGAYDPFAPRTQDHTTVRDFTAGQDAEGVTRSLESLFNSEMGRAPTAKERAVYQKLVQTAYNASPEKTHSVTQVDAHGNAQTTETQSGGIDMTATLLDQVRSQPEHQAQAASTFFDAAMQSLGAIA